MKRTEYIIATKVILNRDFKITSNIENDCANSISKIETETPEYLKN